MPSKGNRFRIFYGWYVVGAAFLISLYLGGGLFYGFTTFFEPIAREMGWNYAQVSFAASLRGLEMGLLAPLTGVLADRWGPKRLILIGAVITTAGLILLSHVTSLGTFYAAFLLVAIGTSGCTVTVLMTAVANWFRRKVGIASGIANCGFGFGGLLIPVMVILIQMYGWRDTMTILGLGMLALVLPLSLLFRHKPEQYGYLPDGQAKDSVTTDDISNLSPAVEVDVKAKQALKSSSFWHIALAVTYHAMVTSAVITHVMPYLSSIGLARSRASLVATAIPLMSIGGRLGLGWLGDVHDRRKVTAGAIAMMGVGTLCFGYASTAGAWLLVPFIVLVGIGYGGCNVLRASLMREYFGRTNFGAIFGLIMGISTLGNITGPLLAGWVFDNWGSYQGIWFAFAALGIVALISLLTVPPVSTAVHPADTA